MIRATFDALTEQTSPEVGRAASRQEGRRPARSRRRERGRGGSRRRSDGGVSQMANDQDQADRLADPPPGRPEEDSDRPRPRQDAPRGRAGGHPRGARRDRQAAAHGRGGRLTIRSRLGETNISAIKRKRVQRHETERHPRQRRRPQAPHARRPGHRLGQGQDRRARPEGPEEPLGRRRQGLRGRPDAAPHAAPEARLQQHRSPRITPRSTSA